MNDLEKIVLDEVIAGILERLDAVLGHLKIQWRPLITVRYPSPAINWPRTNAVVSTKGYDAALCRFHPSQVGPGIDISGLVGFFANVSGNYVTLNVLDTTNDHDFKRCESHALKTADDAEIATVMIFCAKQYEMFRTGWYREKLGPEI